MLVHRSGERIRRKEGGGLLFHMSNVSVHEIQGSHFVSGIRSMFPIGRSHVHRTFCPKVSHI